MSWRPIPSAMSRVRTRSAAPPPATTAVDRGSSRINRATLGVWGTYRDWKNVRTENRRLREEAQRLRVEALRVTETAAENDRLRRLLALKQSLPLEKE